MRRQAEHDHLDELLCGEQRRLTLHFYHTNIRCQIPLMGYAAGRKIKMMDQHKQVVTTIFFQDIAALRDFLNKHFPE
jgi:hypothetical protein